MSDKPKFTLPSLSQIEQAQQQTKPTIFWKSKDTSTANDSGNGSSTIQPPPPQQQVTVTNIAPAISQIPSSPARPASSSVHTPNSTISPAPAQPATAASDAVIVSAPAVRRGVGNAILVNPTQHKNPILRYVHNVPWEPDDTIKPDYVVGLTTGVLYLSLRYHRLYPNYIYERMAKLTRLYVLKVLLVLVDIENYHDTLRELNRTAILQDYTLMLAWSHEEAARYLETYKVFENKPPDLIRERMVDDYYTKMTDCLTNVKSVNKTDVLTLLSSFGSFKGIANASTEQLAMCPGFGEQKVKRLQQAFTQPFTIHPSKRKRVQK
ncbi:restriction endonuclease type II-like protein [Radiomyces spectabilis]|uniref:restriction endonuclease type II-like protein n=1 Tax=Radiomyces spectabilis TaxID=64574 RepID=UPI00221E4040|nr:restriction endonuclease type II-like protein [Radiomyces spectabilis]KAI8379284.1 restriction endonuclease type II-like protein [Radiomyces spectabilis]